MSEEIKYEPMGGYNSKKAMVYRKKIEDAFLKGGKVAAGKIMEEALKDPEIAEWIKKWG